MWQKKLEKLTKTNLVAWEQVCRDYWKEHDIPRKSIEKREGFPEYTFYDGPITANNRPHYGHALTMTLKDVIPRYKTMRGFHVMRSLGWDCQGIPVEYEVEKSLGFKEKKDIEVFGVEKFNNLCRESVHKYQGAIRDLTERMGRWVMPDEEYATMDPKYIESIWWSIKELHKKGLLYQGYKVVPYSVRAGTTLSNAEVALGGYKSIVDTSVTAAFYVPEKDWYLLAWTTTPWTLPGNLMLAIKIDAEYVVVSCDGKNYVCAAERVEALFKDREYKVIKSLKGSDLEGLSYQPLFEYFKDRVKQGAFRVIPADHVTLDDGTGIVHLAPYGEEDFEILNKMEIDLFDYLDEQGHFTKQVPLVEGQFYKAAAPAILEYLRENGLLFATFDYEHEMPMCWRTDTPLIYRPIKSWYVKVTAIKEKLVSENKEITWIPESFKEGRFGNWLENAHDWALSRKRYWGTPVPIWQCHSCGKTEVLGSFEEVKEKSDVTINDPHKPFVDEITYTCPQCGDMMKRDPDVLDVWYDSGAMPFARFHYPFENKKLFEQKYPAAYIAEGTDQTRGWFYSMHVLGVALFGTKAFEHVIVNGMFLAADGKKLSKSKKNYTDYEILLDQFGGDVIRLYFLSTPIAKAESVIFSEKQLTEMNARGIIPLVNMVKYFLTYANSAGWQEKQPDTQNFFDSWMVARTKELGTAVLQGFDHYDVQEATLAFLALIDEVSQWYIHANRDRFVAQDSNALATLYWSLQQIVLLGAPIIPRLSELLYTVLWTHPEESVHFETLLPYDITDEDNEVLKRMSQVRTVVSLGLSAREEAGVRLRQPLQKLVANTDDPEVLAIAQQEVNVKQVSYTQKVEKQGAKSKDDVTVWLDTELTEELKNEGIFNDLVRAVQFHRKKVGCKVGEAAMFTLSTQSEAVKRILHKNADELLTQTNTQVKINESMPEDNTGLEYKIGTETIRLQ